MKNFVMGLVIGILITLGANEFLGKKNITQQNSLETTSEISGSVATDETISQQEQIDEARQKNVETIELLQAEVKDLLDENLELKDKLEAVNKLADKEKASKADVFNFDDIEVTQGDLELARNNILVAMLDAKQEYKDFMQKQMDGSLSDLEFIGYTEKGLVEHHAQSVDYQWAPDAELFLNTYFANQPNKKYQLLSSKCHSDSCEIFVQYVSEGVVDVNMMPGVTMSTMEFIREMQISPGFEQYFSTHFTMQTTRSKDEKSMFVHSIMRRAGI